MNRRASHQIAALSVFAFAQTTIMRFDQELWWLHGTTLPWISLDVREYLGGSCLKMSRSFGFESHMRDDTTTDVVSPGYL